MDNSVELAEAMPKTTVRKFEGKKMALPDGFWCNDSPAHVNFLFDWAIERDADWIIFDDADCFPSVLMQMKAREHLEAALDRNQPAVYTHRVYFYGPEGETIEDGRIFPTMHSQGMGLWAFQPSSGLRCSEEDPLRNNIYSKHLKTASMHLDFPLCLLHHSWPTSEEVERKSAFYAAKYPGVPVVHPLRAFGNTAAPEWYMTDDPDRIEEYRIEASIY